MTIKAGIGTGIACALALAGCGTETDGPRPAESEPGATVESEPGTKVTNTASANGEQASASATLQQRTVGPVSFRYDPSRLAALDSSISVPPDWDRRVSGVKLIDSERERLMGLEECPYGEAGMDLECTPESEAGIAIAMLDDPFADARDRLTGERPRAVTLAGRQGVVWTIGVGGRSTEYLLLPLGNRTVLIEHRTRNHENPDPSAIEQVKDSLRIES